MSIQYKGKRRSQGASSYNPPIRLSLVIRHL